MGRLALRTVEPSPFDLGPDLVGGHGVLRLVEHSDDGGSKATLGHSLGAPSSGCERLLGILGEHVLQLHDQRLDFGELLVGAALRGWSKPLQNLLRPIL